MMSDTPHTDWAQNNYEKEFRYAKLLGVETLACDGWGVARQFERRLAKIEAACKTLATDLDIEGNLIHNLGGPSWASETCHDAAQVLRNISKT